MLVGQEIDIVMSINIALIGMVLVMIILALIAGFIVVFSKIMIRIIPNEKAPVNTPITNLPAAANSSADVPDNEMIAVMTAVIEESGHSPEEIVFKSIKKL